MKCPTCGGDKKHHDHDLWERHLESHASVKRYFENVKRSVAAYTKKRDEHEARHGTRTSSRSANLRTIK